MDKFEEIEKQSLNYAERFGIPGSGVNDARDAFRHTYSSAVLARDWGRDVAEAAGIAWEVLGIVLRDSTELGSRMDAYNNYAGRTIHDTLVHQLGRSPTNDEIAGAVKQAYNEKRLVTYLGGTASGIFGFTYKPVSLDSAINAEGKLNGIPEKSLWNKITDWFSDLFSSSPASVPANQPQSSLSPPIGAFYESVSPAADTAASIADKTPVLLDANNHGLTVDQLAARDTNNDGQLTGAELTNMSAWADLNQNGLLDAGELTTLANASITALKAARGDYTFYTQGNGNPGTGVAATPTINQTAPTLTVPASNYRSLRDTGNHRTIAMGAIEDEVWIINGQRIVTKSHYGETQWVDWTPNQIKQSNDNTTLLGTDGADSFDASYYSATSGLPSSGLVNFMAGGGDDLMGGSTRSDNLWGGTGNDVLFGHAGDDKLYGEDGDDQLAGNAGDGTAANDREWRVRA
jgi:hypothetical protein